MEAMIDVPDLAVGATVVVDCKPGQRILVARSAKGLHACVAVCPHQGRSLEGAVVRGDQLLCPWHGAAFALADGASRSPLTSKPLKIYDNAVAGRVMRIGLD